MQATLRLETPQDARAVEELVREAFWGSIGPRCDEHYLVHIIRSSPALVPQLNYVAEVDGQLVGQVTFTLAKVVGEDGTAHEVLTFGPLSVLPAFKGKGIGAQLVHHTIAEARRMGYKAIVIFGHPDYYPRFGFRPAAQFGITTANGAAFDAHMALPLYEDALHGITGIYYEDPAFEINSVDALAFDAQFPPKEPFEMPPIALLLCRLPTDAQQVIAARGFQSLADFLRFSGREVRAFEGMDEATFDVINQVLVENGYSRKIIW